MKKVKSKAKIVVKEMEDGSIIFYSKGSGVAKSEADLHMCCAERYLELIDLTLEQALESL